jgi:hypothetical protein
MYLNTQTTNAISKQNMQVAIAQTRKFHPQAKFSNGNFDYLNNF